MDDKKKKNNVFKMSDYKKKKDETNTFDVVEFARKKLLGNNPDNAKYWTE